MAELLLGLDGGGSRTRAVVATRDGTVLGTGDAGSSNHQAVGFEPAVRALDEAVAAAWVASGIVPKVTGAETMFDAACLGLAGVDRTADRDLIAGWASERHLARRLAIVNDAELVLAAGTEQGWGVALIAGTGSICLGRMPDGAIARAGGWGWRLGDEGSGYDVGSRALRLATQTADGRAGAGSLLRAVLAHWSLDMPEQLLPRAYREGVSPAEVARLAVAVVRLADAGDEPARGILRDAGAELARHVETVAGRLRLTSPPLALGGGLLRTSAVLREATLSALSLTPAQVRVVDDPALGAVAIARRLLDGALETSLPPV
ncbi:MAG TPA: BadF/BadG/BcrA/BcrD ATPase family protein [Thermomicrobiaceae bacterium]|nr:BadF/BadG/BcrA/BcrD ATPase family protein [Thermomicrobiaceae bacterium]